MLDRVLRIGLLFDFYGALLTEKQRQCLEMHYLNDLSLSEIAEEYNVSRQAVHDILRRAEQTLQEYELKLRLIERYQEQQQAIKQVYESINKLPPHLREIKEINKAIIDLGILMDSAKEV